MTQRATMVDGRHWMLLSAALFGAVYWIIAWPEYTTDGQWIAMVGLLKWTVLLTAIIFAASFVLSLAAAVPAAWLYSATGLVSSITFVIVAVWDLNSAYFSGIHPAILLLFAIMNGYGSWQEIRVLAASAESARA